MLRAAHPEVYEEHRRQKAASLRRNLKASTLKDKKDSFANALKGNKWHAPVKRHQIMEGILKNTLEPRENKLDMAIVAHQVSKFGLERDASYHRILSAQRQ